MNITEERKSWHNAELSKADICPKCLKGALVPTYRFAGDETGIFATCTNCEYSAD
jgi:hypothetical protein